MIVQHPMLWCAITLMAGIVVGLSFPLPYYMLLLAACVVACTLTIKKHHIHDVLTLIVWFLLGCSRAFVVSYHEEKPQWQQVVEQKAKAAQTTLVARLARSGISSKTLALCEALVVGKKDDLNYETK